MLTKQDIIPEFQDAVYVQDYSKKPLIDGVKIIEIKNMVGEDGDFSELIRLTSTGEVQQFPGFQLAQMNRSKMLPGAVKAWHLHFRQDEIQTVRPEDHLIVGLWDLRENSPTKGQTMKITLGGGKSHLVFIPKGVAHGYKNVSRKSATVLYFVDQQFNLDDPDENRLAWDSVKGFWDVSHE